MARRAWSLTLIPRSTPDQLGAQAVWRAFEDSVKK